MGGREGARTAGGKGGHGNIWLRNISCEPQKSPGPLGEAGPLPVGWQEAHRRGTSLGNRMKGKPVCPGAQAAGTVGRDAPGPSPPSHLLQQQSPRRGGGLAQLGPQACS